MTTTIKVDSGAGIVRITFSGEVGLQDFIDAAADAWPIGLEHGIKKFLSEFSNANISLTPSDAAEIHRSYADLGIDKDMKSAIVVPDDSEIALDASLHTYMANTDTWQVKLFFNHVDALDWLQQD